MSRLAGRMPRGVGVGAGVALRQRPCSSSVLPSVLSLRHAPSVLRSVPARYASDERKPSTFHGHLTYSITQRLERERADQERVARVRAFDPRSRNLSLTFGRPLLRRRHSNGLRQRLISLSSQSSSLLAPSRGTWATSTPAISTPTRRFRSAQPGLPTTS